MNRAPKLLTLLLILFITPLSAQLVDEVVTESELDQWLKQYATIKKDTAALYLIELPSSKDLTINLDTIEAVNDTILIETSNIATETTQKKEDEPTYRVVKIQTLEDLLSDDELLDAHKLGILNSIYNPIFLDWVFNVNTPDGKLGLTEKDSIQSELRKDARNFIVMNAPELFTYHSEHLPDISQIKKGKIAKPSAMEMQLQLENAAKPVQEKIAIEGPKPSFWSFGGQFQAQVSQAYISPNWYNGGESNMNAFFMAKGSANYNDKKRIQWENNAEWKLGLIGSSADELRWLRVNDDLFKLNTKFGVKAFGTFFYTLEGEMQTQFCNTFVPNSNIRSTAAFSPIRTYVSIGMDYKYKDELSVFVSPVSYKNVFVADTTVLSGVSNEENIARRVGIEAGKRTLNQVGGLLRVNYKHKFNDDINLETNFSFYANYIGEKKGVEVSWEVIGNFIINRFFSCRISLHPRFDNTIVLPEGVKNKIQLKEFVSIGFNYKI